LFDMVVAENGAHLYRPASGEERVLGKAPPDAFVAALSARGVERPYRGRVVVSTTRENEAPVREAITALGLALRVIANKGSVMVLPEGVDKGSGLRAALTELGLSPLRTVGVGDAENDHDLLACCECAIAMANALPCLKERADWVTTRPEGAGVEELVEHLLDNNLGSLIPKDRSTDLRRTSHCDFDPHHP